jgi:hypothetical protein
VENKRISAAIDKKGSSAMSAETIKQQYPELYRQIWERGVKAEKRRSCEARFRKTVKRIVEVAQAEPQF